MAELPMRTRGDSARRRFPIGLDLGTTALKWVQLGMVNGQLQIVDVGYQPLRTTAAASEADRQAERHELLRQFVKQHPRSRAVVLSLPLEDVNLRVLKMPVLPEGELAQAIRWQIEQTLPAQVSYEEFIIDHVALQAMASQSESRVLVASVPRQLVMSLVEHVRRVSLQPVAIDIDPMALAACVVGQQRVSSQETVLLLHFGATTASFSVVAKGQLVFSRSLLTTGQNLTQAIADHLRVSWEKAEEWKRTVGMRHAQDLLQGSLLAQVSEPHVAVARALASPLESLIVDVLHAFKSFSHQVSQSQIQRFDRVLVDGGGALLPGLVPWLQVRLGVPVELVNPLDAIPMTPTRVGAARQPRKEHTPAFTLAMGLALRDVPRQGPAMPRINLLPRELQPSHGPRLMSVFGPLKRVSPVGSFMVAGLIGAAVLALWPGVVARRYRLGTQKLRQELEQLKRSSVQLKTQQQALHVEQAKLVTTKEQLQARRRALTQARQSGMTLSETLLELAGLVPTEVWLTKLSFTGDTLHLVGATRDPAAVVTLMAALDHSGRFSQTTFSSTQRSSKDQEVTFTFEISTKPVWRGGTAS